MAGRDRFARIAATGLFMRTPKDAQPQKTNGVENNFLDVRIWLLFFALLISAGVVGYAVARSTKPAAPSVTTAPLPGPALTGRWVGAPGSPGGA